MIEQEDVRSLAPAPFRSSSSISARTLATVDGSYDRARLGVRLLDRTPLFTFTNRLVCRALEVISTWRYLGGAVHVETLTKGQFCISHWLAPLSSREYCTARDITVMLMVPDHVYHFEVQATPLKMVMRGKAVRQLFRHPCNVEQPHQKQHSRHSVYRTLTESSMVISRTIGTLVHFPAGVFWKMIAEPVEGWITWKLQDIQ